MPKLWLTTKEAAQRLGLKSQAGVTHLCRNGRFPGAKRWGKQWRIPTVAVNALMDSVERAGVARRGRPPMGAIVGQIK